MEMVELETINEDDAATINNLLTNHYKYTQSSAARKVLDNFKDELKKFVKVMPVEYKRVLGAKEAEKKMELTEVSDG